MSVKIGFVNQKGGVGKTTLGMLTCTALSAAPFNKKCAFIDCDSQESAVMQRRKDIYTVSEELSYQKLREENQCLSPEETEIKLEQYFSGIREKISSDPNKYFSYPVFYCETEKLMELIVELEDQHDYDFIFVDMPGQAQGDGLSTLLITLDHAFVPVESGDFDIASSISFLEQKLFKFKKFKESRGSDLFLNINIVFNKVKDTLRYKDTILSFKERFKDDPRVNLLDESKCLSDSVFYKDNTSTYMSILDAPTKSKTEKEKQNQFSIFVTEFLNVVQ
ncbi:MAG: ParA family protein [Breznakibacter sp.]